MSESLMTIKKQNIEVNNNSGKSLGEKIKEARKAAGLNQTELAYKLNVGRTSITLWENGARTPRIENLKEIIRVTNVEPEFFLEAFEDDIYFDAEEKELIKNINKKTSASVDLADVETFEGIQLTEDEIQKIIDYTNLLIAARK